MESNGRKIFINSSCFLCVVFFFIFICSRYKSKTQSTHLHLINYIGSKWDWFAINLSLSLTYNLVISVGIERYLSHIFIRNVHSNTPKLEREWEDAKRSINSIYMNSCPFSISYFMISLALCINFNDSTFFPNANLVSIWTACKCRKCVRIQTQIEKYKLNTIWQRNCFAAKEDTQFSVIF